MSNDVEIITETFNNFMVEMNQWEINAHLRVEECLKTDERIPFDEFTEELEVIKAKYLTDKIRPERGVAVGYPPIYTPELEKITEIEIKGKTAVVKTDRIYSESRRDRIYRWKKVDGIWRLDSAKEHGLEGDKWYRVYL